MTQPVECPQCGCNDVELVKRTQWHGVPNLTLQCNHCNRRWSQPEPEAPPAEERDVCEIGRYEYPVLVCPKCSAEKPRVTHTKGTIRKMKCQACGYCYKLSGERKLPLGSSS